MLSERRIQDQVNITPSGVSVRWCNQVLRDGIVIASSYHRRAFTECDYDEFVVVVENGQALADAIGWLPGKALSGEETDIAPI